jgi:hypothetical protein
LPQEKLGKVPIMKKTALVLATAATLGLSAVTAPTPAEARGGWGWGLAGGLLAGALIGGLASSAYAYGPYGYYGYPGYYGGYAPAYYGYRYRRVVRPAFAYYAGPRYYHRWHRRHW